MVTTSEIIEQARDWIADCFDCYGYDYDYDDARDIVNRWPEARIVASVDRHFVGGWREFCATAVA